MEEACALGSNEVVSQRGTSLVVTRAVAAEMRAKLVGMLAGARYSLRGGRVGVLLCASLGGSIAVSLPLCISVFASAGGTAGLACRRIERVCVLHCASSGGSTAVSIPLIGEGFTSAGTSSGSTCRQVGRVEVLQCASLGGSTVVSLSLRIERGESDDAMVMATLTRW